MATYSAAGGRHGVTQWSLGWKNLNGEVTHDRSTNPRLVVENILLLRWTHGNDFPVTICRRHIGSPRPDWDLSSWDDLVAALYEPDREECRIRQGWIEPVDR
ncbi:MAG TPA: hypothetical protein VHU85_17840 [Acidimicrobiales bacterium]|jgi:hypothetical protein|nr:hypothetical protein [Acidimicrobiales bacterium]